MNLSAKNSLGNKTKHTEVYLLSDDDGCACVAVAGIAERKDPHGTSDGEPSYRW